MKKALSVSCVLAIVICLRWGSQVLFDVFYSTESPSYLGIPHGSRTYTITPLGYEELHINTFTNSLPSPYHTSHIGTFQDLCDTTPGNCKIFIGQGMFSSYLRINIIQYIAREVEVSMPSDITNRFASLHDLDPKRYYPYILLQLIGTPSISEDTTQQDDAHIARNNVATLGERGIAYACDQDKIQDIARLSYSQFIEEMHDTTSIYRNTCQHGGSLAHDLAFNYYYYLGNKDKSVLYYKVASFHDDVPTITSSMPALIEGALGEHRTSAYLWYDRLQQSLEQYNSEGVQDTITDLEGMIQKSLQKTISEYSLHVLDLAQTQALQDKEEVCSIDASCLESKGYTAQVLDTILHSCTEHTIDCELINLGIDYGRITKEGILHVPHQEPGARYQRDINKERRSIKL